MRVSLLNSIYWHERNRLSSDVEQSLEIVSSLILEIKKSLDCTKLIIIFILSPLMIFFDRISPNLREVASPNVRHPECHCSWKKKTEEGGMGEERILRVPWGVGSRKDNFIHMKPSLTMMRKILLFRTPKKGWM